MKEHELTLEELQAVPTELAAYGRTEYRANLPSDFVSRVKGVAFLRARRRARLSATVNVLSAVLLTWIVWKGPASVSTDSNSSGYMGVFTTEESRLSTLAESVLSYGINLDSMTVSLLGKDDAAIANQFDESLITDPIDDLSQLDDSSFEEAMKLLKEAEILGS